MLRVYSSITKLNVFRIKVGRADEGGQSEASYILPEGGGWDWREPKTAPGAHIYSCSLNSHLVQYRPIVAWSSGFQERQPPKTLKAFFFLTVLTTNLTCFLNHTPMNWIWFTGCDCCLGLSLGRVRPRMDRRQKRGQRTPKEMTKHGHLLAKIKIEIRLKQRRGSKWKQFSLVLLLQKRNPSGDLWYGASWEEPAFWLS